MPKSLHVAADIYALRIDVCAGGVGTAWQSSAKILSSVVGVPGVRKGNHVPRLSYWLC